MDGDPATWRLNRRPLLFRADGIGHLKKAVSQFIGHFGRVAQPPLTAERRDARITYACGTVRRIAVAPSGVQHGGNLHAAVCANSRIGCASR